MFNFLLLIEQIGIYIPIILAVYICLFMLKISILSIEISYVFGPILAYKFIITDITQNIYLKFFLSLLLSILGGIIVSIINYLIQKLSNSDFLLSSIIVSGIFSGLNQFLLRNQYISLNKFTNILKIFFPIKGYPHLITILIICILSIILFLFFIKSPLGICAKFYGKNKDFFSYYEISSEFVLIMGILFSGALAGISGFLASFMNGFIDLGMGNGINLFCITTLVLGQAFFKISHTNCFLIIISGLISYFLMQQFLIEVNFNSKYFSLIQGLILFFILLIQRKNKNEL